MVTVLISIIAVILAYVVTNFVCDHKEKKMKRMLDKAASSERDLMINEALLSLNNQRK